MAITGGYIECNFLTGSVKEQIRVNVECPKVAGKLFPRVMQPSAIIREFSRAAVGSLTVMTGRKASMCSANNLSGDILCQII